MHQWGRHQQTVPKLFTQVAQKHPEKILFYYEDQKWTYKQVIIFFLDRNNLYNSLKLFIGK